MSSPDSKFDSKFDAAIWDEWFNEQLELTERIRGAVEGLSAGKDDAYRAAMWAAVIEAAAERIRFCLHPVSTS